MHELGITQNIVAIAVEYAGAVPVKRVSLEIGQLSAVMPEAIQFCFEVCCRGTIVEGAQLEIIEIPGIGQCCQCGTEVDLDVPFGICPSCGSVELKIIQGEELNIKTMEVESPCV
ncbi:MAG: hydrogenase maturation nickel metallochaperone HypA [Oscillatoriales cyanobacterium RM1_1_9]|nr:hydrogenase maturation nickel metallochaperone HypA [Oscillatoriales cyanobacterium SM2_3_0]NJO44438.1 hydrogenase maturation nickel metallochaperone HypA [Oscillatoriales cyanobacterium RM2_1_1]NJO71443.1 hydrogenase maturation nickel metallochaperone HypA [Oscillatoriales cyanobacterium RM1_1_9]